jgi:hypothetical protein
MEKYTLAAFTHRGFLDPWCSLARLRDPGLGQHLADLQLVKGARVGGLAHDGRVRAAPRPGDRDHLLGHVQQPRVGGHEHALDRDLHPLREAVERIAHDLLDRAPAVLLREGRAHAVAQRVDAGVDDDAHLLQLGLRLRRHRPALALPTVAERDGDDVDPRRREDRVRLARGGPVRRGHDDLPDPQRQRPLPRDLERRVGVVLAGSLENEGLKFHDALLSNHMKRVTPPPVTEIVAQAPEGEPLSLDEIDDIVHEVRRRRKAE